jgi:hypothetical protein
MAIFLILPGANATILQQPYLTFGIQVQRFGNKEGRTPLQDSGLR